MGGMNEGGTAGILRAINATVVHATWSVLSTTCRDLLSRTVPCIHLVRVRFWTQRYQPTARSTMLEKVGGSCKAAHKERVKGEGESITSGPPAENIP